MAKRVYKDIDDIVVRAFKGKGRDRKLPPLATTCLCGSRRGYPHDEYCPFPYFGCKEGVINMWEVSRAQDIETIQRCKEQCHDRSIRGRLSIEVKLNDPIARKGERLTRRNAEQYRRRKERILKKRLDELEE